MAWWLVVMAAFAEVGMALALKASDGWSRLLPSVLGVVLALLSIYLLTKALQSLPTGPAYAVWTGLGVFGVSIVGIVFLGDGFSTARAVSTALIVAGVIGLHLS
jgi:quaternary ammonium compound-resistance protein SugE